MNARLVLPAWLCLSVATATNALSQPPQVTSDSWQRVDGLMPDTRIVMTSTDGTSQIGRFRQSTSDEVTIAIDGDGLKPATEVTLAKSSIQRVTTYDPQRDGVLKGALSGAGAMIGWLEVSARGCGVGCENDLPAIMPLLVGSVGAGAGSLVGYLVDRHGSAPQVLFPPTVISGERRAKQSFPARTSIRIGPTYSQTGYRSSAVEGSAGSPGFVVAVQVLPMLSAHVEYSVVRDPFLSAAGSVPVDILENLVPATSRVAGPLRGIESRRIAFMFSELVGIHPRPWGPVRLEFLAGAGVRGQEDRDYYDAYRSIGRGTIDDPTRIERIAGKYSVLNFESSEIGWVFGVDAEIVTLSRLRVIPMFRYNQAGNPGPTVSLGAAANWRF